MLTRHPSTPAAADLSGLALPRLACSLPPDWRQLRELRHLTIHNDAEWAQERQEAEGWEWGGFSWGAGSLSALTALTGLVLPPYAVLPGEALPCDASVL